MRNYTRGSLSVALGLMENVTGAAGSWGSPSRATSLVSIRGRSLASSSSSSSSLVLRLMQEKRSREAKKAEEMLAPTQFIARSSLSQATKLVFSIDESGSKSRKRNPSSSRKRRCLQPMRVKWEQEEVI